MGIGLSRRHAERGQTILLIAVSIVALLAMAALAIDVVTLYVSKSEIQRAADAVALAAAKAVADSGVTTLQPTDLNFSSAQALAVSMANSAITAMLTSNPIQNPVGGALATCTNCPLASGTSVDWSRQGNPVITVTLQRTNLPTFFALIFGKTSALTGATATAEVYNPANNSPATQIQERCVKPWLVANCDPNSNNCSQQIVNPATGLVEDLIGQNFYLNADCHGGQQACLLQDNPPTSLGTGNFTVEYVPSVVPANSAFVPACGTADSYQESIAGCDPTPYTCGGGTTPVDWSPAENPAYNGLNGDTGQGTECLASNQDTITYPNPLFSAPPQIKAGGGPLAGQLVSTSNSIVTIPIFEPTNLPPSDTPVVIVGFLQAFIDGVGQNPHFPRNPRYQADVNFTVMNVVGCSTAPPATPPVIGGNGASAIPVRLITSP